MESPEEMEKFLERYNLPRLNQEETENKNRLTTSTEIETVILKLPVNKHHSQQKSPKCSTWMQSQK